MEKLSDKGGNSLDSPHLSLLAAWALAFGCSVGWGAFVMPGTVFLPNAGSLGSFIGGVSLFMPFLGRTAIGWIVDVTTIGASIVYAYISICSVAVGKHEKNRRMMVPGLLGTAVSVVFLAF